MALSNLRNGTDNANEDGSWLISVEQMPFTKYEYCVDCSCRDKNHGAIHETVCFSKINEQRRGNVRPWQCPPGLGNILQPLQAHQGPVKRFTYVKQFADKLRPECGAGEVQNRYGTNSGAFDQLGWGTLMLYRGE